MCNNHPAQDPVLFAQIMKGGFLLLPNFTVPTMCEIGYFKFLKLKI